jgi:hypothetical protein
MGTIPTTGLPKTDATSDASAVLRHDTHARFYLGVIVIVQFVLLVAYVIYAGNAGKQIADSQLILGAEIGFVSLVLNYFFGSSSGSVTKSARIDAAIPPK